MAANHPTHTFTTSPQHSQLPLYGAAQQPSPANSTSPNDPSPTSPLKTSVLHQLPLQSRQLRPPKSPLYVPAVLRPTERPLKQSPLTPPKSLHGSWDSLQDDEAGRPISQQSAGLVKDDALERVEEEWVGGEGLGEVTDLPTREHWKPDNASPSCDSPACRNSFGIFLRRHHCRHCGHIFCASHTPYAVPLDQDAHFHPEGFPSRACQHCHTAYKRWEGARILRRKESQNSKDDGSAPATPISGGGGAPWQNNRTQQAGGKGRPSGEAASSVPRDWNWSTF